MKKGKWFFFSLMFNSVFGVWKIFLLITYDEKCLKFDVIYGNFERLDGENRKFSKGKTL